jgi:hypothetical protein
MFDETARNAVFPDVATATKRFDVLDEGTRALDLLPFADLIVAVRIDCCAKREGERFVSGRKGLFELVPQIEHPRFYVCAPFALLSDRFVTRETMASA